ncbi:hypothetical protein SAMN04489742_4821 [Arthrobacter crystallopoietes]|uniref:Rhodanese domain-containing protein n=1 Tax=Crystallibacter crystallopoietes TaxID=37928 RepID=A0A1H1HZ24_9MICC|nr:hypothetical protein SAMN04489742_4821 [Arthrobacter crystallopoietes]
MAETTIQDTNDRRSRDQILDVREDFETAEGMIPEALHIPMGELNARLSELDRARPRHRGLPQRQPQRPRRRRPQHRRLYRRHHDRRHDRLAGRRPAHPLTALHAQPTREGQTT